MRTIPKRLKRETFEKKCIFYLQILSPYSRGFYIEHLLIYVVKGELFASGMEIHLPLMSE